jgi:hypothetical protein
VEIKMNHKNIGDSFNDFLSEEGILKETEDVATKRVVALKTKRRDNNLTKARQLTESCKPTPEECKGCDKEFKVDGAYYCLAYSDPTVFWRNKEETEKYTFGKKCNLASHIKEEEDAATTIRKRRIGQQKQRRNW